MELNDLNDLLLTSWSQIPQQTFRGLVESIIRLVMDVLLAKERPTHYLSCGSNAMLYWVYTIPIFYILLFLRKTNITLILASGLPGPFAVVGS